MPVFSRTSANVLRSPVAPLCLNLDTIASFEDIAGSSSFVRHGHTVSLNNDTPDHLSVLAWTSGVLVDLALRGVIEYRSQRGRCGTRYCADEAEAPGRFRMRWLIAVGLMCLVVESCTDDGARSRPDMSTPSR